MSTSIYGNLRSPKELGVNWEENFGHEDVLAEYYKKKGFKKTHLCQDWDYMAIHEESPEFSCCTCDKDTL